jgi:hypothetical protein
MEASSSEHQLCIYADPPAAPPYHLSAAPCIGCHNPVQVHPVCDACVSMSFVFRSANGAACAATTETPESSSGEYGDSFYGGPEAARDRLRELEENPEVTLAPTVTGDNVPPPLDAYRKYLAPIPPRNPGDRFDELAQIFAGAAGETAVWSARKDTWLRVTYSGLGRNIEPLPAQLALIAEKLMYEYPSGIICFYLDIPIVHHVRTGNETATTNVGSAISLLRSKHGMCSLCFTRKRVGVLEVLTWPTQTSRGNQIAARIKGAATSKDVQRLRRQRPQCRRV